MSETTFQTAIAEILVRHGTGVTDDPVRLRNLLRDYCTSESCRREINVTVQFARSGLLRSILGMDKRTPAEVHLNRLVAILHDDYGIDQALARNVVETWMGLFVDRQAASGSNYVLPAPKSRVEDCPVCDETFVPLASSSSTRYQADAESKLRPGVTKAVGLGGGVQMVLVWCPAGSFVMGSPETESSRGNDENPHHVTLTRGFWLCKHPVTQQQWSVIMGANPSTFKGQKFPIETVSWDDCQSFIKKMNAKPMCRNSEFGVFRLPAEAEWEYACRAGTTGQYAGKLDALGWYTNNSGRSTHTVGSKKANALGLFDMHGNVWEWCQDWYGAYPGTVIDPKGPTSGTYRVRRGGGWYNFADGCRSANRSSSSQQTRDNSFGLRLVLSSN